MTVLIREVATGLQVRDGGDGRTLVGPLLPWGVEARVLDRGRLVLETFERGALAGTDPTRVPLTSRHPRDNQELPIGVGVELEERADAAWGAWKVSKTAAGDEVLELARDGVPLGLSIGFMEVPGGSRWSPDRRRVTRTRALVDHVAIVRTPAYVGAGVVGVRSEPEPIARPLLATLPGCAMANTPAALGVIVGTGSSGAGLVEAARRLSAERLAVASAATACTPYTLAVADAKGGAMSDDRPRAPTYGPPITIPSVYFLGLVAYQAWCDAHLDDPAVEWEELSEAERAMWQRIATKVAERIRDATEHSHALGNYLPPPRCSAKRQDRYTFYICCRWDPHPADHGTDDEGHRWVPVEP